uniref:Methionine--tRNA ligase, cytoplasmic n=1 Tax=Hucho hucho TaxID=62062 RepID=A0A4W5KHA7_9TELE
MKLFVSDGNPHCVKVLAVLRYTGVTCDVEHVNHDERVVPYLSCPALPALLLPSGTYLFRPNSICRYLIELNGQESSDIVNQWLEWEATELQPALMQALHMVVLQGKGAETTRLLQGPLSYLDQSLSKRTTLFLTAEMVSVADVVLWAALYPILSDSSLTELQHWFERVGVLAACESAAQTALQGKGLKSESLKSYLQRQPAPHHGQGQVQGRGTQPCNSPEGDDGDCVLSEEEIQSAVVTWGKGLADLPMVPERQHPILPKEGKRNVLVTSALPYVNNVPHLGNIIGCVLSADVYARYGRLRGWNVLYVCGTDEYGTATENKAREEGLTAQQICDKYHAVHASIYQWFQIDFDFFGRTTTKKQTEIAQNIFWRLHERGFLLEDVVEQLRCEACQRFLADRFVEGTCPFCSYPEARGDQCDKCGKLINAVELRLLKEYKHDNYIHIKQLHLFMKPFLHQPMSQSAIQKSSLKPQTASNADVGARWLGKLPRKELIIYLFFHLQVFYVWFDAPIGYLSITANYTDQWEKWWKNPQQVQRVYQSVESTCSCELLWIRSNEPPCRCFLSEYLNYEDTKFSKSRGVGVFGDMAKDTGIPSDVWRFYLLYLRPEGQDSAFSWVDMATKNNSELLNNLGNFINRAGMFVSKFFENCVPAMALQQEDKRLLAQVGWELKQYINLMDRVKIRDALKCILNISRHGNQYIQVNEPWKKIKGDETDRLRSGTVTGVSVNVACLLSVMLQPYMPTVSQTIRQQLNAPPTVTATMLQGTGNFVCSLPAGHHIGTVSPLFQKLEAEQIESLKKRFGGQQVTSDNAAQTAVNGADAERARELTLAVAEQGEKVRTLKGQKAEKAVIGAEVTKLLELKKQLSMAEGKYQEPVLTKGKKNAQPAPTPASDPAAQTAVNGADAERARELTLAVAEQVRWGTNVTN